MANGRFENERYVCWLKVCMALLIVKEALEKVTDTWVQSFHQALLDKLGHETCFSCSNEVFKRQRSKCRQDICNKWVKEIEDHAIGSPLEWTNSDIQQLSVDAWACIRLLMPFGCGSICEAKQADIAAMLTLYINNSFFLSKMGGNVTLLEEVKDIRNKTMHSADMEIMLTDMQAYMKTLKRLLRCTPTLSIDEDCLNGIADINKLETTTLEISTNKEAEIRALNDRVMAASSKAEQAYHLYKELRKDIEEQRDSNTKQTDVDELFAKYSNLHTKIENTNTEFEIVKRFFSAFLNEHQLAGIDVNQLTEKGKRLKAIYMEAPTIKADIKALEKRITQLQSGLDDHQKDIDSLKITTQKHKLYFEDIHVSEKAMKIDKEQCKKDIHDRLLKAYKRNHKRIPIYPPKPSLKKPLDQLYVVQSLKVVDHRGKPERKVLMIENDPETEEKLVKSLYGIFHSEENPDEMCEYIILSGEAGSGKSTFCEHLINTWYRSQTNKDQPSQTSHSQFENEEQFMLHTFSYLIFINLRDAKLNTAEPENEITQWILNTYEFPKHYAPTLNDILGESRTLLVFDALDESKIKYLPRRSLNFDCIFLIASRPWKIETLRSEIEEHVDRQVEVEGLENNAASALAEKVTNILNKEFNKTKGSAVFLQEIKDKFLNQFLKIPVLIMHMLCLWFDDKPFGNSQIEIYGKLIHNHVLSDIKTKKVPHTATSTLETFPLFCNKKDCLCIPYSDILWNLSKLAFDALLDENKENSLVFDHNEMKIHGLCPDEVDICLKVGLLTQHMLYGSITDDESKAVSFIHKTHQEYFAAVYLSYRCHNVRQVFHDHVDTLDRALEYERVLMFAAGMNPEKVTAISYLIMEKASRDERVLEYRLSCEWEIEWAPHEELIRRLQTIIFDIVEEAIKNDRKIKLNLEDVCVIGKNVYTEENVNQVIQRLKYIDLGLIKSIYIRKPGKENIERIWFYLKDATQCLTKLVLYKCFDKAESVLNIVEKNKSLNTLQLCGTVSSRMLVTVLSVPCLQSLGLCNIKMSHGVIEEFCKYLSTSHHLRELRLLWLSCETHQNDSEQCEYAINLSNNNELKRIELVSLRAIEIVTNFEVLTACDVGLLPKNVMVKFLNSLSKSKNLENFGCRKLKHEDEFIEYFNTIRELDNLKTIDIWLIDFGDRKNLKFKKIDGKA